MERRETKADRARAIRRRLAAASKGGCPTDSRQSEVRFDREATDVEIQSIFNLAGTTTGRLPAADH